eukprot:COSAG01_NODE_5043_length_4528_cov_9.480695_3_plen_217_part_00
MTSTQRASPPEAARLLTSPLSRFCPFHGLYRYQGLRRPPAAAAAAQGRATPALPVCAALRRLRARPPSCAPAPASDSVLTRTIADGVQAGAAGETHEQPLQLVRTYPVTPESVPVSKTAGKSLSIKSLGPYAHVVEVVHTAPFGVVLEGVVAKKRVDGWCRRLAALQRLVAPPLETTAQIVRTLRACGTAEDRQHWQITQSLRLHGIAVQRTRAPV